MAFVRKRKGTKMTLTTGKKSAKYRKLNQSNRNNSNIVHTVISPTAENSDSINEIGENIFEISESNSIPKQQSVNNAEISTQTSLGNKKYCNISTSTDGLSKNVTHADKLINTDLKIVHNSSTQYSSMDFNQQNSSDGEQLIRTLTKNQIWNKFAQLLTENEQTEKFVQLISSISTQTMPITNMSWKAALDMGSLYSCTTTSRMTYDKEWLEFCQVMYHMFGGGVMNTLRGKAHFSHITSSKSRKGHFKPVEGEFNFPIPSLPTLKKIDIGYPTEVPVGIIQHSLDLASERAAQGDEFILSFDGKLVSPGCKGTQIGDCNMWGCEGPPTISKALKILEHTIKCAEKINVAVTEDGVNLHKEFVKNLLITSTRRIKRLRERITGTFYLRKKLIANVGDNEELKYKYRRRMSTLNHNTAECQSVIR